MLLCSYPISSHTRSDVYKCVTFLLQSIHCMGTTILKDVISCHFRAPSTWTATRHTSSLTPHWFITPLMQKKWGLKVGTCPSHNVHRPSSPGFEITVFPESIQSSGYQNFFLIIHICSHMWNGILTFEVLDLGLRCIKSQRCMGLARLR